MVDPGQPGDLALREPACGHHLSDPVHEQAVPVVVFQVPRHSR